MPLVGGESVRAVASFVCEVTGGFRGGERSGPRSRDVADSRGAGR